MNLRDRIEHPDRRSEQLPVVVERRDPEPRRQPRWMERMQRDGLPPKDMTGAAA